MRMRLTPPAVPTEMLSRFGEPEEVFGPNTRFLVRSTLLGVALFILGFLFLCICFAGQDLPLASPVGLLLAPGLLALGVMAMVFPWRTLTWVFVCPRGLLRNLRGEWEEVSWEEVAGFEDAPLGYRKISIRQCWLVLKDGTEWGFLADRLARYRLLTEVLHQKVAGNSGLPSERGQ